MWSSVPRALSRQTAPAVAAGAASSTSVSSIMTNDRYVYSPITARSLERDQRAAGRSGRRSLWCQTMHHARSRISHDEHGRSQA